MRRAAPLTVFCYDSTRVRKMWLRRRFIGFSRRNRKPALKSVIVKRFWRVRCRFNLKFDARPIFIMIFSSRILIFNFSYFLAWKLKKVILRGVLKPTLFLMKIESLGGKLSKNTKITKTVFSWHLILCGASSVSSLKDVYYYIWRIFFLGWRKFSNTVRRRWIYNMTFEKWPYKGSV